MRIAEIVIVAAVVGRGFFIFYAIRPPWHAAVSMGAADLRPLTFDLWRLAPWSGGPPPPKGASLSS